MIAYLKVSYAEAVINFLYYNSHTKDAEITSLNDWDIPVSKAQIMEHFRKEQEKKKQELKELESKQEVFEKLFGKYFDSSIGASMAEQ